MINRFVFKPDICFLPLPSASFSFYRSQPFTHREEFCESIKFYLFYPHSTRESEWDIILDALRLKVSLLGGEREKLLMPILEGEEINFAKFEPFHSILRYLCRDTVQLRYYFNVFIIRCGLFAHKASRVPVRIFAPFIEIHSLSLAQFQLSACVFNYLYTPGRRKVQGHERRQVNNDISIEGIFSGFILW